MRTIICLEWFNLPRWQKFFCQKLVKKFVWLHYCEVCAQISTLRCCGAATTNRVRVAGCFYIGLGQSIDKHFRFGLKKALRVAFCPLKICMGFYVYLRRLFWKSFLINNNTHKKEKKYDRIFFTTWCSVNRGNEDTFGGTDTFGKMNCESGRCSDGFEEVATDVGVGTLGASLGHCKPCPAGGGRSKFQTYLL